MIEHNKNNATKKTSKIPSNSDGLPSYTKKSKRGRPKGSKTKPAPVVEVAKSRCPVCGSTRRTNYSNTRSLEFGGEIDGRQYTKVIWRNTRCLECGQNRIDKTYE